MLRLRPILVAPVALLVALAAPAGAAVRMYPGHWVADSFGNDKTTGTASSEFFSALNNPQGVLCNGGIPVCSFKSTPTSGGEFQALGPDCAALGTFMGGVTLTRPAKGKTITTKSSGYVSTMAMGVRYRTPPLYRNQAFFTPLGAPNNVLDCAATTTAGHNPATHYLTPFNLNRGPAQLGAPLTGNITANVDTGMTSLPFTFAAAPASPPGGMRRTTVGSFSNTYPYLYSYTYRTLRNGAGSFKRGGGFFTASGTGTFVMPYKQGANTVGKAVVKAGANRAGQTHNFGGVMRLLGPNPNEIFPSPTPVTTAHTTGSDTTLTPTGVYFRHIRGNGSQGKVCYFNGMGCSLGGFDWEYRFAGTFSTTAKGTTMWSKAAKIASAMATQMYYNTAGMQSSVVRLDGWRFPWTTGTVTVTATGRGPHKTYIQRKGFDKRTSKGSGTIQLVTPIVTRWLQPSTNFETSGVAVMRLPEPHKWALLVAGLSMLGLLYRARGR